MASHVNSSEPLEQDTSQSESLSFVEFLQESTQSIIPTEDDDDEIPLLLSYPSSRPPQSIPTRYQSHPSHSSRLLSSLLSLFPSLSRITQLESSDEERRPLLTTSDGFPDDPPPYYTETTSDTIDVLPTYHEVTAANEDNDMECLEQCGGFLLSAFFFILILGAAILTVLPLFLPDEGPFV